MPVPFEANSVTYWCSDPDASININNGQVSCSPGYTFSCNSLLPRAGIIGEDRYGGDLSGMPLIVSSSGVCYQQCSQRTGCVAWAFNYCGSTMYCWLKGSIPTSSVEGCIVSAIFVSPITTPPQPTLPPPPPTPPSSVITTGATLPPAPAPAPAPTLWAGSYSVNSGCDTITCCCLTGTVQVTQNNLYVTIYGPLIGSCGGATQFSGFITLTTIYDSTVTFTVDGEDYSATRSNGFITVNNLNAPQCSGSATCINGPCYSGSSSSSSGYYTSSGSSSFKKIGPFSIGVFIGIVVGGV